MGILTIKNLTLSLGGRNVLEGLNIDFKKGRIHALMGPNGTGKSTTAYAIMGLDGYRHFDGDILFDGKSIRDLSIDERARLGITLAWQEPARYEGLKIRSFIEASARDKSEASIRGVLEKVDIDPEKYLGRSLDKTLSGGERKKIELASILAMRPRLVVLDEPDSGIDVASLQKIFDALKYFKNYGATVILITHSLEVLKYAEHAFLLCNGSIFDEGDAATISNYFKDRCLPCKHRNAPIIDKKV